jgi:periplasmic divalent cation tolerance protein
MEPNDDGCCVVLTATATGDDAERLARALVERRLAACVSIVGPVRSVYRWRGAIQSEAEHLLIIKTTRARWLELREAVLALHGYATPEVLVLAAADGSADYLDWIRASVGSGAAPD